MSARAAGLEVRVLVNKVDLGIPEEVQEALDVNGPALVEVDMSQIGAFPRYFVPPKADSKYTRS